MSFKTKKNSAAVSNAKRVSNSQLYLWHFQSDWCQKFHHTHWWKDNKHKPTKASVVWEILRRNPKAEQLLQKNFGCDPVLVTNLEWLIGFSGLRSWNELHSVEQRMWNEALKELPPQRGICFPANSSVKIFANGPEEIKVQKLGSKFFKWDRFNSYPDAEALKSARRTWRRSRMNEEVFEALAIGHSMISFDPQIPGIERLVLQKVKAQIKETRRLLGKPSSAGRTFWQEWLQIISEFESAELSQKHCEKRNDQLFARYRRQIANWEWPT